MRKFEFSKSYKEIEIAGEVYKIRFDDEAIYEYHETFEEYYKEAKRIEGISAEGKTNEELHKDFKEKRDIVKEVLDTILGNGAYETLYEKSGHSTMGMVDVVAFVSDVVGDAIEEVRDRKKKNYIEKK